MTKLPERLQYLKTSRNIMQKDIASDLGIPLRTYQRYERGEGEPNVTVLARMAQYFAVSADYLLGLSDEENAK